MFFLLEHLNTVTIPTSAAHAVRFTGHDGVLALLLSHKTRSISGKTPYQARVLITSSIQVHTKNSTACSTVHSWASAETPYQGHVI